jgi:transcriptional regulator
MYTPKHFAVEDREELLRFIGREPFGILVSAVKGAPIATHLPFVVLDAEAFVLAVHLARANEHWKDLDGAEVLAIFQGPHAMVSASWYADPQHSVPTWNYSAVHCIGRARVVSAERTRNILQLMVARFESGWTIEDADSEYINRMERGIVGIEIAVTAVTGKYKYSQNRSAEDRERVISALGDTPLAQAMREFADTDTAARLRK